MTILHSLLIIYSIHYNLANFAEYTYFIIGTSPIFDHGVTAMQLQIPKTAVIHFPRTAREIPGMNSLLRERREGSDTTTSSTHPIQHIILSFNYILKNQV